MNFYKAMRFLKSVSKAKMPIKVRKTFMKGLDGCCLKYDDHFLIKINKNISEEHSIDVLIHEIAHADADIWDVKELHGKQWAICFGRLYRCWEKYIESN